MDPHTSDDQSRNGMSWTHPDMWEFHEDNYNEGCMSFQIIRRDITKESHANFTQLHSKRGPVRMVGSPHCNWPNYR